MIDNKDRYLELLKQSLVNQLYLEMEADIFQLASTAYFRAPTSSDALMQGIFGPTRQGLCDHLSKCKQDGGFLRATVFDANGNESEAVAFRNFVFNSHTMTSRVRMDSLHRCMGQIILDKVPGDFAEVGAWKGGAGIFMRGFLAIHDIPDRHVWVADSFDGPPKPRLAIDDACDFGKDRFPCMAVSLEAVKALFSRYDLLDERVCFLAGWFRDTLPIAPIAHLALLRIDGTLYESTMDGLQALYDKLSSGGFVVVNEYLTIPACKMAVDEFRREHDIDCPLVSVDDGAVFWRKDK